MLRCLFGRALRLLLGRALRLTPLLLFFRSWALVRDILSETSLMFKPFKISASLRPVSFAFLVCLSACKAGSGADGGDGGDGDGDGDGDNLVNLGDGDGDGDVLIIDGTGGAGEMKPPAKVETSLPSGFTAANFFGGWRVLGPLEDFEEPAENSCANVLRVVIRDFPHSHVDFGSEKPATWAADGLGGWYKGQILPDLPEDTRKPVVSPTRTPLDVMEAFEDWYVNLPGVNLPYVMDLWLQPDPANEGAFIFHSDMFFPLAGYPAPYNDGDPNFGFTTELHTAFEYKGGEVFTFTGDDDVFVFINGKLAVDIGGIHNAETESIQLDAVAESFGLTVGEVYDLDMFQAERNPGASNYKIETTLDFQSCGILVSDIVVK